MKPLEAIGRALDAAEVKPQDVVDALDGAGYEITSKTTRGCPACMGQGRAYGGNEPCLGCGGSGEVRA